MNVCSAFGLTPAAIIRLANVWRHSCSVIGRNRASRQASFARLLIVDVANGVPSARPNTRPSLDSIPVLDEVVAENRGDRHLPAPGDRLRVDHARLDVPRALDAEHAAGEVDVDPSECLQLAAPEARVEGGGPQNAIHGRRRVDQKLRLLGRREARAPAPDGRDFYPHRRVDLDIAS